MLGHLKMNFTSKNFQIKTDDFSEMMAEALYDVLTTIYDGNNYDYDLLWQQL